MDDDDNKQIFQPTSHGAVTEKTGGVLPPSCRKRGDRLKRQDTRKNDDNNNRKDRQKVAERERGGNREEEKQEDVRR